MTPNDYAVCFVGETLLVRPEQPYPYLFARHELPDAAHLPAHCQIRIGTFQGAPLYALALEPEHATARTDPVRDALAQTDAQTSQQICRAKHLLHWHRTTQYCGACGAPTTDSPTEIAKICTQCPSTIYPSTASVVIVLIVREDHILLARSPHFAPGLYSTIAGFVDAGESYEAAVHREVYEEVGCTVDRLTYFGSQSWPFPASMTVAYRTHYVAGTLRLDPTEIEDAQWFHRTHLPRLPHPCSLSRQIIDTFQNGP